MRLAGSSPRVRGKLRSYFLRFVNSGLIPARAGKTVARSFRGLRARAHPRACGENKLLPRPPLSFLGSSPRVRGKPSWIDLDGTPCGLIPARAGKTL